VRHRTIPTSNATCRSALDASSIQGAREETLPHGPRFPGGPSKLLHAGTRRGSPPPLGRTSGGVFFGAPPAGESASYPPGNTPSGLDPSPSFVLSDFTRRTNSASFCGRGDEPTWLNALRNWPASVSGNFIGSSGAGGQPRMGTPLQEKRPRAYCRNVSGGTAFPAERVATKSPGAQPGHADGDGVRRQRSCKRRRS
jgi:hypothetical protein